MNKEWEPTLFSFRKEEFRIKQQSGGSCGDGSFDYKQRALDELWLKLWSNAFAERACFSWDFYMEFSNARYP